MSANKIRSEEARLQQEEIANVRALRKRRHKAISISVVLEDDGEDNMVEKAALEDVGPKFSVTTDKANGGLCSDADDANACEVAVSPAVVFNVNDNAIAGIDNNHPQRTMDRLREQVAQLENTVVRLRKSECRWRKKYDDLLQDAFLFNGSTLKECADNAVEYLMKSEN